LKIDPQTFLRLTPLLRVREVDSLAHLKKEKTMKSIFMTLLGITCLSMMPCEAKSRTNNSHPSKKSYVNPHDIRITEDGIFILERGRLVPVGALSQDKKGVYIKKEYLHCCRNPDCRYVYDWDRHTHCPRCRHAN
jgi:hypothetical protein